METLEDILDGAQVELSVLDIPQFLRRKRGNMEPNIEGQTDLMGAQDNAQSIDADPATEGVDELPLDQPGLPSPEEMIATVRRLNAKRDTVMAEARQKCAELDEQARQLKKMIEKMVKRL